MSIGGTLGFPEGLTAKSESCLCLKLFGCLEHDLHAAASPQMSIQVAEVSLVAFSLPCFVLPQTIATSPDWIEQV